MQSQSVRSLSTCSLSKCSQSVHTVYPHAVTVCPHSLCTPSANTVCLHGVSDEIHMGYIQTACSHKVHSVSVTDWHHESLYSF